MKLTCVTATYNCIKAGNRERLIRCVGSVAKVKMEHEHLIYDGASTDGTSELLYQLEARTSGLKVFSEADKGIYNALNKGVRAAKGEWLYFLGSDDYIIADETLNSALAQGDKDNADIVVSPVSINPDNPNGQRFNCYFRSVFGAMPFPHQGMLMKACLVSRMGGFDEQYKIVADYDLLLRALMSGARVSHFNAPFAFFSCDGLSSRDKESIARENLRVISENLNLKEDEAAGFFPKKVLPIRTCIKLLFNGSSEVRRSARYHLGRWCLNKIGLITENGVVLIK